MNAQAQIARSTARLHEINTLLGLDSLKFAPPEKLGAFLGEANELLALKPYSGSGHEVLAMVRVGVTVWEKASALVEGHPRLASPYVCAVLAEMPAFLLAELESFRPWFIGWVAQTHRDVAVRLCLEAQGLYRPNHEPRGRDLDRENSPAVIDALAAFGAENLSLVVRAAYDARSGDWPQHGYPNGNEVEAIRLFHRIEAMGGKRADTEVNVSAVAPPLLEQLL